MKLMQVFEFTDMPTSIRDSFEYCYELCNDSCVKIYIEPDTDNYTDDYLEHKLKLIKWLVDQGATDKVVLVRCSW